MTTPPFTYRVIEQDSELCTDKYLVEYGSGSFIHTCCAGYRDESTCHDESHSISDLESYLAKRIKLIRRGGK